MSKTFDQIIANINARVKKTTSAPGYHEKRLKQLEDENKARLETRKANALREKEIARICRSSLQKTDWGITFDVLKNNNGNEHALSQLQKWHPAIKKGAVLYGSVGTGKSWMCKALINKWASPDCYCFFKTSQGILDMIKSTFDADKDTREKTMFKLSSPKILVIDDLGSEKSTEWSIAQLFNLIEQRISEQKVNFITTNLGFDELYKLYGARISDRLSQWCIFIKVTGPSFRSIELTDRFD